MSITELIKRFILMLVGMFITAFGLAVCVKANLGISPITTLAYTMSNIFPNFSLGTFTFFQHVIFYILMILLLRRDFRPYQLLMLPCSFLFGAFIDLGSLILESINPSHYAIQLLLLMLGIVIVGFGFSCIYTSGIALESNTAFINALSLRTKKPYHTLKVSTDLIIVAIAAIVSFSCLHKIIGIREGTLLAAFLIGWVAGFFNRRLAGLERFLKSSN